MPTFYPTEQEFRDPVVYIDSLKGEASAFGCLKIIPPDSFKPPLAFDTESDIKLPSRYQVLQQLSQGVPFNQNTEGNTFAEFRDIASRLEKEDEDIDWSDDQ